MLLRLQRLWDVLVALVRDLASTGAAQSQDVNQAQFDDVTDAMLDDDEMDATGAFLKSLTELTD